MIFSRNLLQIAHHGRTRSFFISGAIDKDPDRYGKSALRKRENGKLVDTNNSTNDFVRDSKPT